MKRCDGCVAGRAGGGASTDSERKFGLRDMKSLRKIAGVTIVLFFAVRKRRLRPLRILHRRHQTTLG
jgi:hypothetical protein